MSSSLPTGTAPDMSDKKRQAITELAAQIAMDMEEVSTILARKQITNVQYEKIVKNAFYQRVLQAYREAWHSATNAERRLALASATMIEHFLPKYVSRLHDPNEPLPAVNEGMKVLMKMASIGERGAQAPAGEKFTISINLGGGHNPITHEVIEAVALPPEEPPTMKLIRGT